MGKSDDDVEIKKDYEHKKADIENSMSKGIESNYDYLTKHSKYLSKNEIKAIALLKDNPLLKKEVANLLALNVHVKGWITEKLYKFWEPFTKAFQTIYYNKQVQKALKRLSFGGGGSGDW